jgi:hypothetical protein
VISPKLFTLLFSAPHSTFCYCCRCCCFVVIVKFVCGKGNEDFRWQHNNTKAYKNMEEGEFQIWDSTKCEDVKSLKFNFIFIHHSILNIFRMTFGRYPRAQNKQFLRIQSKIQIVCHQINSKYRNIHSENLLNIQVNCS